MNATSQPCARGFSLLEILVTMLVVSVGLMGLAGLLARVQVAELEAYQRSQALIILSDIVERLNVNRKTLPCFRLTTNLASGTPYIGATGTGWSLPAACAFSTSVYNARADTAIAELNTRLQGMAEVRSGATIGSGAMIGARACISYDATTELPDSLGATIAGTGLYTITVAWQGMVATQAVAPVCANGLYGAEAQRRAVLTTVRFASLTAARLDSLEVTPWL